MVYPQRASAGNFPVLRGVAGDYRLAMDPGLSQREAEGFQPGREVNGPAAHPEPAQLGVIEPSHEMHPGTDRQRDGHLGRAGRHEHAHRPVHAVIDRGEPFSEPLRHVLVGLEDHWTEDQLAVWLL